MGRDLSGAAMATLIYYRKVVFQFQHSGILQHARSVGVVAV